MVTSQIAAIQAGRVAQFLLKPDQPVSVLGVTSRGVFARLVEDWVVFLSYEAHAGPLTVHLSGQLPGLRVGESGAAGGGRLVFAGGWEINGLEQVQTWEAPPPPVRRLPVEMQQRALREVAMKVVGEHGAPGFSGLLAPLLSLPLPVVVDPHLVKLLRELQIALASPDWAIASPLAARLLGLGRGLTPSGDDLLLGLLLGLIRSSTPQDDNQGEERAAFCAGVATAARSQTTALSASLLACAAEGQADERLVMALDGLLTGALPPEACTSLVLSWGSSSGADALVGMALAISR